MKQREGLENLTDHTITDRLGLEGTSGSPQGPSEQGAQPHVQGAAGDVPEEPPAPLWAAQHRTAAWRAGGATMLGPGPLGLDMDIMETAQICPLHTSLQVFMAMSSP